MQVNDEIAHQRVVDGALRRALPRRVRRLVIGKDADDVETRQIAEFVTVEILELATENKMQQLGLFIRR